MFEGWPLEVVKAFDFAVTSTAETLTTHWPSWNLISHVIQKLCPDACVQLSLGVIWKPP